MSGSQIRLVPTRSLLVSLTLSTGARFHCQETPEAWNRFEVPPEISSPDSTAASRTLPLRPAPNPPGRRDPRSVPLPGSALRAGCRRVGGSARPKAAGHDCRARRKAGQEGKQGWRSARASCPPGGAKLLPRKPDSGEFAACAPPRDACPLRRRAPRPLPFPL